MSDAVRDIVITGGGLAGWYCAARLCHAMRGRALNVRVVRAAPRDRPVDPLDVFCASTLSTLPVAHAELGIDERTFMRACDATFKLVTEYRGFTDAAAGYLLPFGEIGARLEAVGFHQFVSRLARSGHVFSLDDFSVPSIAARLGRFAHPTRDARSALSTYEYAYHLDTRAYTQGLRGIAEKLGAVAIDEDLVTCEVVDGERIRALTLADGSRVTADLFIDCTGARAALLGDALRAPFESWRAWLPCDAAMVGREPAAADMPPCTTVHAFADAWSWRCHYAARCRQPGSTTVVPALRSPRRGGARTPAQPKSILKTACIASLARQLRGDRRGRGFVEPLASTGLRLIDGAVARLVELFPDAGDMRLMAPSSTASPVRSTIARATSSFCTIYSVHTKGRSGARVARHRRNRWQDTSICSGIAAAWRSTMMKCSRKPGGPAPASGWACNLCTSRSWPSR
jgi:tryptophan halogenase